MGNYRTKEALNDYRKRRYKRLREGGICIKCPKKSVSGKSYCQECLEKRRLLTRKYQDKYRSLGLCVSCGHDRDSDSPNCEKCKKATRARASAIRLEVMDAYGGRFCACCGESELKFLAIDHVNGGGGRHRREVGGSDKVFRDLKKRGFPPGFQVLCHNCNFGRHINGGVCPHKAKDGSA